jgi:hypothetical protein
LAADAITSFGGFVEALAAGSVLVKLVVIIPSGYRLGCDPY